MLDWHMDTPKQACICTRKIQFYIVYTYVSLAIKKIVVVSKAEKHNLIKKVPTFSELWKPYKKIEPK